MLPTPSLSHLTGKDYESVYEPAEDSFLLMDALEKDADEIRERRPRICLEIGSGSGCVSTFLSRLVGPSEAVFLCTDINPIACKITERTGRANNVVLDAVNADFALPLLTRLRNQVDILIFNPPYVVTSSEELKSAEGLELSWAGGIDGREVISRFLKTSGPELLLSPTGVFYLVTIQSNRPEELQSISSLHSQVCAEHRTGIERLKILKFWRK